MAIVQHLIRQHENCKGLDELVKGYRLKSKTRSSVSSPGPLIDLLLQQKLLIYFEGLRNSRANISNESVTQETLDFLRPLFLALLESSKAEEDGFIYTWQSFVEDFNLSPEESEEAPVYLLLKRVNRDALAQLSLILFSECVQEGRRKDLHLHPVSWAGLILSFVTHQEKFHKMDVGVNELAHILKIVHEVLGEANAHDRLLVLELFRDFCISTSLVRNSELLFLNETN